MVSFVESGKLAVVRPLLKKLGLDLISPNYRPVSNLTFISKVIEWCMLLQVSQHCEEYQLQLDYQSAYREHYSCEMAILKISNDILWGMEAQINHFIGCTGPFSSLQYSWPWNPAVYT